MRLVRVGVLAGVVVALFGRFVDEDWLELAGSRGWAVLMKDKRIRYRPPELEAVERHRVRCFCLARQDLPGQEMAERFLRSLPAMVAACEDPGPFVYMVYRSRIRRIELGSRG